MKTLYYWLSNGIGNTVQMTPALQACHELGYEITIGVNSQWGRTIPLMEILQKCPFISEIKRHPEDEVDLDKFDDLALFDTQEKGEMTKRLLVHPKTRRYKTPEWAISKMHESEYFMQLPRDLGYKKNTPKLFFPVIDTFPVKKKKRVSICFSCLAEPPWHKKRWDNKKWANLIDSIILYYGPNIEICLLGGKKEIKNSNDIISNLSYNSFNIVDYVGKIALLKTAKIIHDSDVLISLDNGLSHIGAAVGTYVIALFGPTFLSKNKPLTDKLSIVSVNIDCSPCQQTDKFKKCKDNLCMKMIEIGDVFNEIRQSKTLEGGRK